MAVRQDGAVVVALPLGVSPRLVVLDGVSGQEILTAPIPATTLTGNSGPSDSCDCYSPVGQPTVDTDGSIYAEYEVRQFSPYSNSVALSLMKIAPDSSTSATQLGSSNVANLWPGQIIPDGQGGILATWANERFHPPAAPNPYQAADVTAGVVTSSFDMPMAPQNLAYDPNTSLPLELPLVLAGNGAAIVSYGPNVASFAVNGGSLNWNYQAPSQTVVSLVGLTDNLGIAASSSQQGVIQLDVSGVATQLTSGNAVGLPRFSWKGAWHALTALGSQVSGIALPIPMNQVIAWGAPGGNPSGNKTAVERCAPLDPTTNASVDNAYSSLISFLQSNYCPLCNSAIFVPFKTSQAEFTAFLTQGHMFCDGTKSTEPGASIGRPEKTVAQYFQKYQGAPDYVTAATAYGGRITFYGLLGLVSYVSNARGNQKTFFAPVNVASMTPAREESMMFHESIHGFTGLTDGGMIKGLCETIQATPQQTLSQLYPMCYDDSDIITDWIYNNIIAP